MLRKIINFYVVTVGNQLSFRVIEMQRLDKSTPIAALTRANTLNFDDEIELVVEAIYQNNLNILQLLQPLLEGRDVALLEHFNQLPGTREEKKDQLRAALNQIRRCRFHCLNWFIYTFKLLNFVDVNTPVNLHHIFKSHTAAVYDARDSDHPDHEYAFHDISGVLPVDAVSLLTLLGALDGMIARLESEAAAYGYQVAFNFCGDTLELENRNQVITNSVKKANFAKQAQSRTLARFVSQRIIVEIQKNPDLLNGYSAINTILQKLVVLNSPYLCRVIFEMLHPQQTIQRFIEINAKNDTLMLRLFNPAIHHYQATQELLSWAASQPNVPTKRQDIEAKMTEVITVRLNYWVHRIKSLFGLPAPDGGYYNSDYTELLLLQQSKMYLNVDGLMVLDLYETPAYQSYYSASSAIHNELETELRAVCGHLGLEFIAGINFHKEIVFTAKSTVLLMNQGMHYSFDYLKSLLHLHIYRFSQLFNRNSENNPFYMLPMNVKSQILKYEHPLIDEEEINIIGRLTMK